MTHLNSANSVHTQTQRDAIKQFVDFAEEQLDSDGITQWVDSSELIRVNNALATLGSSHGAGVADAALDELADNGLLETFVKEMYGAGIGGELPADTRSTIFSNIATYGDGQTLAAFARTLESSTNGVDGYERTQDFVDAVASQSSAQTKVELITALAADTTQGRAAEFRSGALYFSTTGDTDAAAVATVLGSLDGAFAREVLNSLTPSQFHAVINASIEEQQALSDGSASSSFDASSFSSIASVVAQNGTVEQRAQVFDTAGRRVDLVADAGNLLVPVLGNKAAAAAITDGMTELLTSDTNAVIQELAFDRRFHDGRALTDYVEQLVETGQTDKIASLQTQLLLGNDGAGDHGQRFNELDANNHATNAGKIGYFSGAVQNAVDNIHATGVERRALEQDILGTTSSILSGGVAIAYPVAGFAIGVGGEGLQQVMDRILAQPRANIDELIINSAIPFNLETNNVERSSIAFGEFQNMIDKLEDSNRRNGD